MQCFWIGADGATIDGQLNARYTDEHHGLMYETVIHRCHLDGPTPQRQPGKAVMIIGWSAYDHLRLPHSISFPVCALPFSARRYHYSIATLS